MPRSPYSSGSPYPTGRAPFSMDLSSQMDAITQQMIQTRRNEIKEKKLQVTDSENAILTALDFKTLEGAGDKFAAEHAKRLDELNNKWALRFKERGGIISTQDKLELAKDKRDVESKLQIGAADLAQINEIRKEIQKGKNSAYDIPKTIENLNRYYSQGLPGSGGATNVPVMKKQMFGQGWLARMEPLATNELLKNPQSFDEDITKLDELGNNIIQKSNRRAVENFMEFAKQDEEYQELMQQDPEQAKALADSFMTRFLREPQTEKTRPTSATRRTGSPTYSQRKAEETKSSKIQEFGNLAQGLADMKEDTVSLIKTSKFGGISDIYYDKENGEDYMFIDFQPTSADDVRATEKIKLPTTDDEKKIFYKKVWSILPKEMQAGISLEEVEKSIQSSKGEGKKMERVSVTAVNQNIEAAEKNASRENIKKLVAAVKDLFPEIKIESNAPIVGARSVILDGKEYSFKDKAKIDEFKAKINELIGNPQATETGVVMFEVEGEGKFSIPANEVDEFLKSYPSAKRIQ